MMREPGPGRPTIRSVAAELGVSAMTITRALSGHPSVKDDTRRRVAAKVKELGYDFRRHSRILRRSRAETVATHCSGLIFDKHNHRNFFGRLYYLLIRRLRTAGLYGRLVDLDADPAASLKGLEECGTLVFMSPVKRETAVEVRRRFPDLNLVSLLGNGPETVAAASVEPDDCEGGAMAARLMAGADHRRVAVFSHLEDNASVRRYRGFRGELARIAPESAIDLLRFTESGVQRDDDQARLEVLERYFAGPGPRATAFFAFSEYAALFLLDYLERRGHRVPDDFGLLAYDNPEAYALHEPPVSRIYFDLKTLVAHTVSLIKYARDASDDTPLRIVVPNRHIAGGTLPKR